MALRQIHRRYSNPRFISNALSYCKNSRTGASFQESGPIFKNSSALQKRVYFKNRENEAEWYHFDNPKRVGSTVFLFSCGVVLAVASGDWITVPYTGRSHFVIYNRFIEKFLPDTAEENTGKTLHPFHPDYMMARRIFQDIIHVASQIEKDKGIELSDDCEIIVPVSDGFRKIHVTTGVLNHYRDHEAMIATILGAEVGTTLAKHNNEIVSKLVSLMSGIGMSLYLLYKSAYIQSKIPFLEKLVRRRFLPSVGFVASVALLSYLPMMKYMRKIEMEKDYIGLMMAASAGYDPRVGRLFPVYGENLYERKLPDCFYPIPSDDKRSKLLSQPKVLNEAISRYNKARNAEFFHQLCYMILFIQRTAALIASISVCVTMFD